jgi:hypothetical protein
VEKTNVGGAMGFIRIFFVKIHHKPQPSTLIPTSHVPIAMHMGMMPIITPHFTHNYDRASPFTGGHVSFGNHIVREWRNNKCGI